MKEKYYIVVLPGDGIGTEVCQHALHILEIIQQTMNIPFEFETIPCGGAYYLEHEEEWPPGSFEKCKAADAILLGAVGHQVDGKDVFTKPGKPYDIPQLAGYAQVIGNRKKLNLYANVRPIKLYPNVPQNIAGHFVHLFSPNDVDYVIVRENTEGAYSGKTYPITNENGEEVGKYTPIHITKKATEQIVRFAFQLAQKRNKQKKVTCVDKSNIIGAHQYFREIFTQIGKEEFPHIQTDFAYFDAFCQWQMRNPENFDVVVAPNLVGDVISDNGAITAGGLGFAAGANIGEHHAMFEPIHGSAPKYAGLDKANPCAAILASTMMLTWLSEKFQDERLQTASIKIEQALTYVCQEGKIRTPDMGGNHKGSELAHAIAKQLQQLL